MPDPATTTPLGDLVIRPLLADDLATAEQISGEAFLQADRAARRPGWPEPTGRSSSSRQAWLVRSSHFLSTDPAGCWAASLDGELVGFATSYQREKLWVLATFAVTPSLQGHGIGRVLLERAMGYAHGCLRAMFAASDDQSALRRYLTAGFELHPQVVLHGVVERGSIPVDELRYVRDAVPGDIELMDSLDRRTRGAAHGPDHAVLERLYRGLVVDRPGRQGYARVNDRGEVALLAATDRRTAAALLWAGLAMSAPGARVAVPHVTGANQWGLQVAAQARLSVDAAGFLAVRGMRPPAPYLHHGSLL